MPYIDETERASIEAKLNDVVQAIHAISPELRIERTGDWLWIRGNTKPNRHALKSLGCKWAPKKPDQPWYFAGRRCISRKSMDLDYIRFKYGSQDLD